MPVSKTILKHDPKDIKLKTVLMDYKNKMNKIAGGYDETISIAKALSEYFPVVNVIDGGGFKSEDVVGNFWTYLTKGFDIDGGSFIETPLYYIDGGTFR